MIDWREKEKKVEELKELRNNETNKEIKQQYTKEILKLKSSICCHNHYMGDRESKWTDGDCYKTYGKTIRDLSPNELKEYNKMKKRESRKRLKKLIENA